MTLLLVVAQTASVRALPTGPPTVALTDNPTDQFIHELIAEASDPDGDITSIELCAEGACTRKSFTLSSLPASVNTCVFGDAESLNVMHTFSTTGRFVVTVRATGGGCPGIGSSEITEETFEVFIPEPPPPHEPIVCAQQGTPSASAPGVDADTVRLAATVPRSGMDAPARSEAGFGMLAAVRAINAVGGVCDRQLALNIVDDGSDQQRRRQFLANMIAGGDVFAFVGQEVNGSTDLLADDGIPAVGTPGTSHQAFDSPWTWPIQAGNDTFGWVAVGEAYEAGARKFAVVYDGASPIGPETRDAVEGAVATHADATMVTSVELAPTSTSYLDEVQKFNGACAGDCDAVIYALEPGTMLSWMASNPQRGVIRDSLHPITLNQDFAMSCQRACDGMFVWADFHPPIDSPSEVTRYCADLHAVAQQADCFNIYTEAAYAAVFVAAQAMGMAGVDLTRERLTQALNSSSFNLGLNGGALAWTTERRQANRWMGAYSIIYKNAFSGFRGETGWLTACAGGC